jgi:hypothetical protein
MDAYKKCFCVIILLLQVSQSFAQRIDPFEGKYKEGSFIDLKGNAHKGYVYYGFDNKPWIRFRNNMDEKSMKFKAWKISGFTIEADSFCVLRKFQIDLEGQLTTQTISFAQVMEVGKVILYKHFLPEPSRGPFTEVMNPIPGAGGSVSAVNFFPAKDKHESFIIQEQNSELYIAVREKEKKFKEQISRYFAAHEELAAMIQSGEYQFEDMPAIVAKYNRWYAQKDPEVAGN